MKLDQYLKARNETQAAFAARAGIPETTLSEILRGGGCRISTALRILTASQAEPAPDGARVLLEDLIPEGHEAKTEAGR